MEGGRGERFVLGNLGHGERERDEAKRVTRPEYS
jgi:hypothetical protein